MRKTIMLVCSTLLLLLSTQAGANPGFLSKPKKAKVKIDSNSKDADSVALARADQEKKSFDNSEKIISTVEACNDQLDAQKCKQNVIEGPAQ